jgi:hypothetical protein
MLLQSNDNTIEPLPALPKEWAMGSYEGLVARGNFVVGCEWKDMKLQKMTINSRKGGVCRISYPNISKAVVYNQKGEEIKTSIDNGMVVIKTDVGKEYNVEWRMENGEWRMEN